MSQPPTSPATLLPASSPGIPPVVVPATSSAAPAAPVTPPGASPAPPTAAQVNSIEKASADALEATKAAGRSARMAMIAAIVSGVLAICGTVVGGFIAANSASRTVEQQLSGETERSRAEFLRSQREDLYAAVLEHQVAYRESRNDLFNDPKFNGKAS